MSRGLRSPRSRRVANSSAGDRQGPGTPLGGRQESASRGSRAAPFSPASPNLYNSVRAADAGASLAAVSTGIQQYKGGFRTDPHRAGGNRQAFPKGTAPGPRIEVSRARLRGPRTVLNSESGPSIPASGRRLRRYLSAIVTADYGSTERRFAQRANMQEEVQSRGIIRRTAFAAEESCYGIEAEDPPLR